MDNEYSDATDYDLYLHTRKEILKHKYEPYDISNEPLAKYYMSKIVEEFPGATLITVPGTSYDTFYICLNERAVEKVKAIIRKEIAELDARRSKLLHTLEWI